MCRIQTCLFPVPAMDSMRTMYHFFGFFLKLPSLSVTGIFGTVRTLSRKIGPNRHRASRLILNAIKIIAVHRFRAAEMVANG